jgi:putative acetyltransferase
MMRPGWTIRPVDFDDPQIIDLLKFHLAGMHANSPPGHVFALDLSGLKHPAVAFYALWDDLQLMGFGALKALSPTEGELKSMRTAHAHLRRGVGQALLAHLVGLARARGYHRVSLETGTGPAFEPALAMYRAYGFKNGEAFGDYTQSAFNQFLHLDLAH